MICLLFKTLGDSEHRFCPFDSVLPRMERSGGAKSAGIEDLWKILEQKEEVRENVRKYCDTAQAENRNTC